MSARPRTPLHTRRPPRTPIAAGTPAPPPAETALLLLAAAAALAAAVFWVGSGLAGWVTTGRWPGLPWSDLPRALGRVPAHPADPPAAWNPRLRPTPSVLDGVAFYFAAAVLMAATGVVALRASTRARRRHPAGARWARPADLGPLVASNRRHADRLVLGRTGDARSSVPTSGRLLATEARHSVLVIGPTQSGKTTGLAIPAILEWRGPVVATSVKDDLAVNTLAWRSAQGPCAVFDPTLASSLHGHGGGVRTRWSPISECQTWSTAQKMASWLVESTPGRRGMADAAFWYTTAAKQLAPLLLAAQRAGLGMADVVRWTDTQEFEEPRRMLEFQGDDDAAAALGACAARDDRIRSSVITTLETVLSPFSDALVATSTATTDVSPADLLRNRGTLYLCGPTHEQHRVQGLFASLVSAVIDAAISITAETGRPLDPPLLLVLDEVANVAPVRDLDTLASTGAGLGIQLVTVCQDLSQLAARYDPDRARTIANNHRAKLILSGISDLGTLDLMSGLAGEQAVEEATTTHDLNGGGGTRSVSVNLRRLAPTDELRRVEPGEAVLIYGHLPPARIRLRPWFQDKSLRRRAGAEV